LRWQLKRMMSSTGSSISVNDRQAALDDATECPDSCASDEHDGGTDRLHHNGHVPPVEPRSAFSSGADGDTLVHCNFDCGPPQPRKRMINKGDSVSYKMTSYSWAHKWNGKTNHFTEWA
jgi:hypothetical protein